MKLKFQLLVSMLKDLKSEERQREYLILKFGTPQHLATKEERAQLKIDAANVFAWAVSQGVIYRVSRSLNSGYKVSDFYSNYVEA